MDPRIANIRFYALCLAALACVVVWPAVGVGLWPVVFFFPGCVCCPSLVCGSTGEACSPGTTPLEVTLNLTGVTGTCTGAVPCSAVEGTYVVPYEEDRGNGCRYFFDINPDICPADANRFLGWFVGISTAGGFVDIGADLTANGIGPAGQFFLNNHAASPANCAFGTINLPFFADSHPNCNFSGATLDATL
jgi:hypothetical protein